MRPVRKKAGAAMLPALTLAAVAAVSIALSACGAGGSSSPSPAPSAAAYAGLWHSTSGSAWWIRATPDGDTVALSWEREWEPAVTQQAVLQGDGSLEAAAVPITMDSGGVPAYTGRLTTDGALEMSTVTHVAGVDADIPVTITFVHGSQADYDAFAARRDKNIAEQQASAAFGEMLQTISRGVSEWSGRHGGDAPPAVEVGPGGEVGRLLADAGIDWPRFDDGTLLRPGTGPGTYRYRTRPGTSAFRLSGTDLAGQTQSLAQDW